MAIASPIKSTRKINRSNRIAIGLVAAVLLIIFGAIAFMARGTAAGLSLGVELPIGSVVYDGTYTPVELTETALVTKDSTEQYYLSLQGSGLPLGAHTMAFTGTGVRVFGGGYRVNADGSVESVTDDMEYTALSEPALFKLADRRYAIAYTTITDSKGTFQASDYLYIVMDVVGNARLCSSTMSLKTTQIGRAHV